MFKTLAKVLLILVLIFILIAASFRHSLCRFLICRAASKTLGLKLSIEELNLDILNNSLALRGITMFNPPEFENEILAQAKGIFIKYNLLGFLNGRPHLPQAKVEISEINIIRNEKGHCNLAAFKRKKTKLKVPVAESAPDTLPAPSAQKRLKSKRHPRPKLLIDELEFSVDKVTFIDYKAEVGKPAVIIFSSKNPFIFRNISDLEYVIDSVSIKAGFRNILSNLADLIP